MAQESLDIVVEEKVKPLLESAMYRYLGITIKEIQTDITDRLKKSPLLDYVIDPSLPFKEAKDGFKKQYILKVLRAHFGNVSAAANSAGIDRRSIHRLIKKYHIDLDQFRNILLRPAYIKELAISDIITKTLDNYKQIINAQRLDKLYKDAQQISKDIVKELPEIILSMAAAEEEFERRYLKQVMLIYNGKTKEIAHKIGLRYETLHRKLKALEIS
ncbi:MAG: helix-turn-helix domain-containing protein [Nanoarchaeota archaeon]